ncbi:MED14-domain-containing protein [Ascodesmis nigricans]|uniref:Mediator of RNA polymerase II transcription subunit 14 n=1 Tax=Ascodesmis nigricans TaxID=341454 RepID=A0A4S2N6Q3_9PEZI|nr:MED14-domain-containing protein [Ascodesmis nigricans]
MTQPMPALSAPMVNGPAPKAPGGDHPSIANASSKKMISLEVRRPPIPKITHNFVPLRMLIGRTAQDAWNKFQEVLDMLYNPSILELEKKKRTVEYCQTYRKNFIKLLVLSKWAENADRVSDAIDLKAFLDQQFMHFDGITNGLMATKAAMARARIPNPDLTTAMEVLSTGRPQVAAMKAYVPPPPLTPQETLKTLRHINAFLAIRFGLHETLPPHFRDYKIGSGKATFSVPGEFDVDLSVGSENLKEQLYLVDVRPTYEPAVRPLPDVVFREIELRGNDILGKSGLEGMYSFLHEYFMTAKITTLLRQTFEMVSGLWIENIQVQQIRRTLLIHYWTQRPSDFKRSTIEVGIMRGSNSGPSRIGIRWTCEGVEMNDVVVPLDTTNLSAEALVRTVIALHTNHMLTVIHERISKAIGPSMSSTVMKLVLHPTDSWQSRLEMQLTPSRRSNVMFEPITGRMVISDPVEATIAAERRMNENLPRNATRTHPADILMRLRGQMTQQEVEERARCVGWETKHMPPPKDKDRQQYKQFFPADTRYILYLRRKEWVDGWLVAFVQAESGNSWRVVETVVRQGHPTIVASQPIPSSSRYFAVTYSHLRDLQKMASGVIGHYTNARELASLHVPYLFRSPEPLSSPSSMTYTTSIRIPDLIIRFSSLMTGAHWAIDVLKVCFAGISTNGAITLIVHGRTKQSMTQLADTNFAAASKDSDVSFHPRTGSYVIRLEVQVGASAIQVIKEKLKRIERLIRFVGVIRKFKLNCTHVALGRITFYYTRPGTPVPQQAEVVFESSTSAMKIILPPESPLNRLHPHLQAALNHHGLETVIKALLATSPLLTALDELVLDDDTHILVRGLEWIRIEYRKWNNVVDMRLNQRRSVLMWYIYDPVVDRPAAGNEQRDACKKLQEVWEKDGCGWVPLRTGAAAGLDSVGGLLKEVHRVMSSQGDK